VGRQDAALLLFRQSRLVRPPLSAFEAFDLDATR
jgi:hypothetical protein